MYKLILIFCLLVATSCSCQKGKSYGPKEMWGMAYKFDNSIELVGVAEHEKDRRILCVNYLGDGCVVGSGKRIKVRMVELIVIQYESSYQACKAAKIIGQWHAANWLLDDVTNEPVLESFVKDALEARKPGANDPC